MLPGRRDNAIKNYWNSRTFQAKLKSVTEAMDARGGIPRPIKDAAPVDIGHRTTEDRQNAAQERAMQTSVTKSGRVSRPRSTEEDSGNKENTDEQIQQNSAVEQNTKEIDDGKSKNKNKNKKKGSAPKATSAQAIPKVEKKEESKDEVARMPYSEGEDCIAESDGAWYEAVIMKVDVARKSDPYLVHYNGWESKWDEWLTQEQLM
eukprot:COSAG02_NODE_16825_length_1053_cov_1.184486_1_plen_204_part_10